MVFSPPSAPASEVIKVFGVSSRSGRTVRCRVVSLTIVHPMAVSWSASISSVSGVGGTGLPSRESTQLHRGFGGRVGDVVAHDDRGGVVGDLHPLRPVEVAVGRPCRGEDEGEVAVGVEHEFAVGEVVAHPARVHAGAGQHLQPEIGRRAASSGDR